MVFPRLLRSRPPDRLLRASSPGHRTDRSTERHKARHTQSQTSPSRHRTHPPEPEPGPSGPFDVIPLRDGECMLSLLGRDTLPVEDS